MTTPKFKLFAAAAATVVSLGMAGTASAFTIQAGEYKILIDAFDSATTTYAPPGPGLKCTTTAGCDASGAPGALGSIGSVNPSADTMGIFSVASITNIISGVPMFTRGVDGFLTGIFGNLLDYYVEQFGNTVQTGAVGGGFKIFQNVSDYNPTLGPAVGAGKDLNAYLYPGISGGTLYLEGIFAQGVLVGDTTTTFETNFNPASATLAGTSSGYLDITGGSAQTTFDTNTLAVNGGEFRDAFAQFQFNNIGASNGWTVVASGDIRGSAIPEPTSLALVGLGLLAVAAATRRMKA